MLKNLPFELLEVRFQDLRNMWSGITLSIGSFYSNCLIYTVQLSNVELLVDRGVSFKHFPEHHVLPVSSNADRFLFWMEILLDSGLRRVSWGHPLLSVLYIGIQAPYLISRDDSVEKALFMTACCSMAGEMLSSDLKMIFFVDFANLVRHPGSEFFS